MPSDNLVSREEAIEAPPTNVTVPPGAAAVLSCRTHLALHGHMSWVRIYPETGRVEELANSTEVYREVWIIEVMSMTTSCFILPSVVDSGIWTRVLCKLIV